MTNAGRKISKNARSRIRTGEPADIGAYVRAALERYFECDLGVIDDVAPGKALQMEALVKAEA